MPSLRLLVSASYQSDH